MSAAPSPYRHRIITVASAAIVVAIGLLPSVVALVGVRVDGLAFALGGIAAFGVFLVRNLCNARDSQGPGRRHRGTISVRTWTGYRTIDLDGLHSVRARRLADRWGGPPADYVIVRDRNGACVAFSAKSDLKMIHDAVSAHAHSEPTGPAVRVSRPAKAALGINPIPGFLSGLWSVGTFELLGAIGFVFIIPALELSHH